MSETGRTILWLIEQEGICCSWVNGANAVAVTFEPANARVAWDISAFRGRPVGWHQGEGRGATAKAEERVVRALRLITRYNSHGIEAFPDFDGGILVSGFRGRETLESLWSADRWIGISHVQNDDMVLEPSRLSETELPGYLQERSS